MKRSALAVFLCLTALYVVTCFAQDRGAGLKIAHRVEKSDARVPAVLPAAPAKMIYSNLGPAANRYSIGNGIFVAGPSATGTSNQFVGLPFTPKANSTVTEVEVAVQYDGAGANQVNLSLYTDAGGSPGTIIAGPQTITNLSTFGTCCSLTTWKLSAGLSVAAGTQYWIVADTPATGTGDDFRGVWDFAYSSKFYEVTHGSGWTKNTSFLYLPAGAVFGTVP